MQSSEWVLTLPCRAQLCQARSHQATVGDAERFAVSGCVSNRLLQANAGGESYNHEGGIQDMTRHGACCRSIASCNCSSGVRGPGCAARSTADDMSEFPGGSGSHECCWAVLQLQDPEKQSSHKEIAMKVCAVAACRLQYRSS